MRHSIITSAAVKKLRLTQINLAGFKSFVDPTHIPVPGQRVGIVGPNGCGKSNVIDAVRWVLGETSARHLRGETMQDVLFNGSGDRKPVNRASVELTFDNSLGKAAGQWSSYGEISIKRVLERDGDSTYYINNIPVRRRDIADIFLGTGLGARAYAIIEQGMISRIIEAKPEELRIFLEEAAGVSKYRERRRETETRLRDTRENLLRVDDIRQELAKQLEHLQEQAEVARRYHGLQGDLKTTQNLLWYTRRQEAAAARSRLAREIERAGTELESETAKLRETEKRLEELRATHYRSGDELHACQGALYETNAEVARIEQQITHVRESRQRIEHHITTLASQRDSSQSQLLSAQRNLDESRGELTRVNELVAECEAAHAAETSKLPQAEAAYRASRNRREELQHALAQAQQNLQVEQTRIEHAARLIEQLSVRQARLDDERGTLPAPDDALLEQLRGRATELEQQLAGKRAELTAHEERLPGLEQSLRDKEHVLDAALQRITGVEARMQALSQLQEKLAKGADMEAWLSARRLDKTQRVWQGVQIEAGWEDALEAVLRERLNGIMLDTFNGQSDWLTQAPPGKITVVDTGTVAPAASTTGMPDLVPLKNHVTCLDPRLEPVLSEWLHDVYVAPDSTAGMAGRARLAPGAMLVTPNGYLFTRHSVSFYTPDTELHGVLSRQREIEKLTRELEHERASLDGFKSTVVQAEGAITVIKYEISRLREEVDAAQQQNHDVRIEALRLTEQARRATQRGEQIADELTELESQIAVESSNRLAGQALLEQIQTSSNGIAVEVEQSAAQYQQAEDALKLQRERIQQSQQAHQQAQFTQQTFINKINEIEKSIQTLTAAITTVEETMAGANRDLGGFDEAPWQMQLQQSLATRTQHEQALAAARDALEGMETQLRAAEQERLECEQKLAPMRERIAEVRLKEQEARLTEEQYAQQLIEAGASDEVLAALLAKGTRSGAMQNEINRLNEEIRALGAVNLAALEELKAAEERRNYLDAQSQDLTAAMSTLEDAIRRIDRETRERLQVTFDEVNRHFGEMFPALFGGGQAKLILTGEEILDSGVHVMAQPPGKKNSTIQLLSGGEKALTALSLVFALFQLNPAPFCLLDEVDAPLDDHNTERFCDLVRKMSDHSQFLFISHNKITMEIANQLLGITMQEAGVSRVVAVDIEEAMKLSEAA
jgi:chromosome segregation protein